jgi:thiosulfate/3-mercaptopyruvate sulfurtransferase
MKSIKNISLLIFFAVASLVNSFAQADIISAKDFKDLMKSNKDLVIIDASKAKLYNQNHVKNAIHILYDDLNMDKTKAPLGTIQTPEFIANYMGNLGVSADDEIVVYDGGTQKYSSRMYVTLKYAGAKNVKLVHKDMDEWGKNRIMLTSAAPKKRDATTFAADPQDLFVDLDYVMANKDLDNVVLVDNRTPEEFAGEKKVVDEKFGHIPGSINIPYEEFETASGAFKNKAQLQELADKYGIGQDKEVIFFCKTGVKGAVAYIAFNNILEHPNAKLYEGGCTDYVSQYELVK